MEPRMAGYLCVFVWQIHELLLGSFAALGTEFGYFRGMVGDERLNIWRRRGR